MGLEPGLNPAGGPPCNGLGLPQFVTGPCTAWVAYESMNRPGLSDGPCPPLAQCPLQILYVIIFGDGHSLSQFYFGYAYMTQLSSSIVKFATRGLVW